MNKRIKKKLAKRYGYRKFNNPKLQPKNLQELFQLHYPNHFLKKVMQETIIRGSCAVKVEWGYQPVIIPIIDGKISFAQMGEDNATES